MKKSLFIILLLLAGANYVHAQQVGNNNSKNRFTLDRITDRKVDTPLVVLDKIVVPYSTLSTINTDSVDNITVLKDSSATAMYGVKGKYGVIIITTKSAKTNHVKLVSIATPAPNFPLLLVDGIETDLQSLQSIKPENIKTIQVYKDVKATAIYGIKGTHGVIIVTTKKPSKAKN